MSLSVACGVRIRLYCVLIVLVICDVGVVNAQAPPVDAAESSCEMYRKRALELERTIEERRAKIGGALEGGPTNRAFGDPPRMVNALSEEMEADIVLTRAYINIALAKLEFVLIHLGGPCMNSEDVTPALLNALYEDANNIATAVPDERLESADRKVVRSLEALLRRVLQQRITNISRQVSGREGPLDIGCPSGGCPTACRSVAPAPAAPTVNMGGSGRSGGRRGICLFRWNAR